MFDYGPPQSFEAAVLMSSHSYSISRRSSISSSASSSSSQYSNFDWFLRRRSSSLSSFDPTYSLNDVDESKSELMNLGEMVNSIKSTSEFISKDPSSNNSVSFRQFKDTPTLPLPFIIHLYEILSNYDKNGKVFLWNEAGTRWIINFTHPDLVSTILPFYFNHSSLASFRRQLSVYGMTKIRSATDSTWTTYEHPYLTRSGSSLHFIRPKLSRARRLRQDSLDDAR